MVDTPAGRLEQAREQARAGLAEGYAHGLIDQDQLDDRLDAVERAASLAELDAVTAALRPAGSAALVPVAPTAPAQRMRVLFGAIDRSGVWSVAARTRVHVTLGSASLDLREAVLPPGPIELELRVLFGALDLIVPPGWQIDNECGAIFSGFEQHGGPPPTSGERRVLRITGRVILGGLTIHERLPGESERDARKRRKREQRALAERRSRALPAGDE